MVFLLALMTHNFFVRLKLMEYWRGIPLLVCFTLRMSKKSTPRVTQTTQTINLDINWEKVLAMVIPLTCTYIHQLVKFAFSHLNPCKNSGVHSFDTRNRKQIDCFGSLEPMYLMFYRIVCGSSKLKSYLCLSWKCGSKITLYKLIWINELERLQWLFGVPMCVLLGASLITLIWKL